MTDKEFDKKLRDLCLEAQEVPGSDVWDGIEKKLARKRRVVFWRRVGVSAAAAAVIAVGFIMNHDTVPQVINQDVRVSEPLISELRQEKILPVVGEAFVAGPDRKKAGTAPAENLNKYHNTDKAVTIEDAASEENRHPVQEKKPADEQEGYAVTDYLAFADNEKSERDRRVSLSAASDFYTIFGTGNVNFVSRSMSGGTSGGGMQDIKPLAGSSPNHILPLSAGLGVQYGFGKTNSHGQHRFGIGLGVNYTYLRSSYEALVSREYLGKYGKGSEQASVSQSIHYLGIPLEFYVNILSTKKLFFYARVGCEAEKGLQLKYDFTDMNGMVSNKSLSVSGIQWSTNIGLGFEYRFVDFMGIYVDPRLTYYFDCKQPYSLREEQRLQMNLGLGFRFHF